MRHFEGSIVMPELARGLQLSITTPGQPVMTERNEASASGFGRKVHPIFDVENSKKVVRSLR